MFVKLPLTEDVSVCLGVKLNNHRMSLVGRLHLFVDVVGLRLWNIHQYATRETDYTKQMSVKIGFRKSMSA